MNFINFHISITLTFIKIYENFIRKQIFVNTENSVFLYFDIISLLIYTFVNRELKIFDMIRAALVIFLQLLAVSSHVGQENTVLLDGRRIYEIDGKWEFYWMQLIRPDEFENLTNSFELVSVPGVWNRYRPGGKIFDGDGYATYRTVLRISPNVKFPVEIGLCVPCMATSYRLFVNGILVASNGVVGTDASSSVPEHSKQFVYCTVPDPNLDLVLQIANFSSDKGGPWNAILIGAQNSIEKMHDREIVFEAILFSVAILIGLYHILFYFVLRREQALLILGIFSIMLTLSFVNSSNSLIFHLKIPWELRMKLQFWSLFVDLGIFNSYLYALFGHHINQKLTRAVWIILSALSLAVLVLKTRFFAYTLIPFHALCLSLIVIWLVSIIKQQNRKKLEVKLILFGYSFMFLAVINDVLDAQIVVQTGYLILPAMLFYLFVESVASTVKYNNLYMRFLKIYARNNPKVLNKKHHEKASFYQLTKREMEIIDLLEGGLGYEEISRKLSISINTVRTHMDHIYSKLGVNKPHQVLSVVKNQSLLIRNEAGETD